MNKKLSGFDALLVKMADNDHIKLDNIQVYMFRSNTCHFRDTRLLKIGNTPNGSAITSSNYLHKYTEYSPLRPKFHSVSLYDQPFSRYKVVEN